MRVKTWFALALMTAFVMAGTVGGCDCQEETGGGIGAEVEVIDPESGNALLPDEEGRYLIDFGGVIVGRSAEKGIEVKNYGQLTLQISAPSLSGTDEFTVLEPTEATTVAPEASQPFTFSYEPDEVGADEATVSVATNDPDRAQITFLLRGEGIESWILVCTSAEIEVCPAGGSCSTEAVTGGEKCGISDLGIDFGDLQPGDQASAMVKIINIGESALTLTSTTIFGSSEFDHTPVIIDQELAPGGEQEVTLYYSPFDGGEDRATYEVASSDPRTGAVQVALRGAGIAPKICPQPPVTIDFGSVAVGERKVKDKTFTSCGLMDLEVTGAEITEDSGGEFVFDSPPAVPATLAVGEAITFQLACEPVDYGPNTGRMEIASNDPLSPVGFVTLRCEGTKGPVCDLEIIPQARLIDFGQVPPGQSRDDVFTMVNVGDDNCEVTGIDLDPAGSGDFTITSLPPVPLTLLPAQSSSVTVRYRPTGGDSDTGAVEVASNDYAEPEIRVALQGAEGQPLGCMLNATPTTLNFSTVQRGSSTAQRFTITNIGDRTCTLSRIDLTASSDRAFTITDSPMSGLGLFMPAGSSREVEVTYAPLVTGVHRGTVEVYTGTISPQLALIVDLLGAASGPEICVWPSPVDFGTVVIGQVEFEDLTVSNCGSEDVAVTSYAFGSGTSSEFGFSAPPTTPVTLGPGDDTVVGLAYGPVDHGRDDGELIVTSDDPINPQLPVPLIGFGKDPGERCGNITGRICAKGGEFWLGGARVWVEDASGNVIVETVTDPDGYYTLTCVPEGCWDVLFESGSFRGSFSNVCVTDGQTTDAGNECVTEEPNIAVVWGEWDSIGSILSNLGLSYDFYDDQSTGSLLRNLSLMQSYDIIFLNCGLDDWTYATEAQILQNLRSFVSGGGSLYASDWAYDMIEQPWPDPIDFHNGGSPAPGTSEPFDAAQGAGPATVNSFIDDPNLAAQVGKTRVIIEECCTGIDAVAAGTQVHIRGDRYNNGNVNSPQMVSFTIGSGRVVYTTFHNSEQTGSDIEKILGYVIFTL